MIIPKYFIVYSLQLICPFQNNILSHYMKYKHFILNYWGFIGDIQHAGANFLGRDVSETGDYVRDATKRKINIR